MSNRNKVIVDIKEFYIFVEQPGVYIFVDKAMPYIFASLPDLGAHFADWSRSSEV